MKCYAEDLTKSVVCELEGDSESVLTLHLRQQLKQPVSAKLADLIDDNVVMFTGVFTSEYSATIRYQERRSEAESDWYYVRVTQHNGQLA